MTIENLKLPKARIVSGNPARWEQAKDYHTKQPKLDKNGNPLMQNWVHVAIPKQDFINEVWPQMVQEAATKYPNATQIHPDNYLNERFAWKVIDGDSPLCPEGSKVPYNQREGFPGHYIIKLSTYAFCPDTVVFQNGAYRKIDESQVKTGDYIVCSVKLEAHSDKNGGLYWNPNIYELVELGTAISSGEGGGDPNKLLGDASSRTGGFQGQLPQAGQVTPQVLPQAPVAAPVAYLMPRQPTFIPPMPQAPAAHPSNPIQPAHDFVQNAMGVQQPFAQGEQVNQSAMPQLPTAPQMVGATAAPATSFPGNAGIPGLPQPR